jgi:hypothetical protein
MYVSLGQRVAGVLLDSPRRFVFLPKLRSLSRVSFLRRGTEEPNSPEQSGDGANGAGQPVATVTSTTEPDS